RPVRVAAGAAGSGRPRSEVRPARRSRHGSLGAGAGRVGRDGGGASGVPQIVDEDLARALGLGKGRRVLARRSAYQLQREGPREILEHGPVLAWSERDDHVKALASGGFDKGLEVDPLEELSNG